MHTLLVSLSLLAGTFETAQAQAPDDTPKAEWQPAPTPVTEHFPGYYLPNSLPKWGTREVWQYYGVDQSGRWRPRVVATPLGAYYLHSGEPYYFTTTRPEIWMPYVLD